MSELQIQNTEPLEMIGPDQIQTALKVFLSKIGASEAAAAQSCVRCGLCADSCHYHLSDGEQASMPAHKLNLVLSVFKRHFTRVGRLLPGLIGARALDQAMLEEWVDTLYGRCSMCGRCTINCTSGINIASLVRAARSAMASIGLVPTELQSTVNAALESGNNMGIAQNDWLDTLDWIEEELQAETGDPEARIPIDQPGKRLLYTVNPREPKFFPLSLLAAAKIFYAAKESWTFSSRFYDVTNYGLFSGDDDHANKISAYLQEARKELRAEILVLGECGHGYSANRWNAAQWSQEAQDAPILSIIEILHQYIREGRITVDPAGNRKRVTLHDPCNLVRHGGIIEEQRDILRWATSDFVEMIPNRQKNFCCGGGGGQLSMTRFSKRRLASGVVKADQIRRTESKVVVTPCHNCVDQLSELNREYKLGVEIKSIVEIVGDALVLPEKS